MYRLFVAIDPPEDIKDNLFDLCSGLPGAKWVDDSLMHITLKFMGSVDGNYFEDAGVALSKIKVSPFELVLSNVGFFPLHRDPETLWVGLQQSKELIHLQQKVESALVRLGFDSERRKFSPHIRLANIKFVSQTDLAEYLVQHSLFKLPPFQVSEFCLYSSYLTDDRAWHQLEATYPLSLCRSKLE